MPPPGVGGALLVLAGALLQLVALFVAGRKRPAVIAHLAGASSIALLGLLDRDALLLAGQAILSLCFARLLHWKKA